MARWVLHVALASCLLARSVAADGGEVPPAAVSVKLESHGLAREYFWISSSATLLTASLAGLFGLRAYGSYDRARRLPGVDPARLQLRDETERNERYSDYLTAGAGVLAALSVLVALFTDWEGTPNREYQTRASSRLLSLGERELEPAKLRLFPAADRAGAGLTLRGELP
jgi:hypothetical protein